MTGRLKLTGADDQRDNPAYMYSMGRLTHGILALGLDTAGLLLDGTMVLGSIDESIILARK